MSVEVKKRVPGGPGWYWAKSASFKWHNLIVNVRGEPPFMYCLALSIVEGKFGEIEISKITEWGPELPDPEKPTDAN